MVGYEWIWYDMMMWCNVELNGDVHGGFTSGIITSGETNVDTQDVDPPIMSGWIASIPSHQKEKKTRMKLTIWIHLAGSVVTCFLELSSLFTSLERWRNLTCFEISEYQHLLKGVIVDLASFQSCWISQKKTLAREELQQTSKEETWRNPLRDHWLRASCCNLFSSSISSFH